MMLFRRLADRDDWRGMWIFKSSLLSILTTKNYDAYPYLSLTIYIPKPYFLRLGFELRYRE